MEALLYAVMAGDQAAAVALEAYCEEREPAMFTVGKSYLFRTVTHYILGRVVAASPLFLKLADASWVADTGRFHEAMATGKLNEVEPYPDDCEVIVNALSITDAGEWLHPLPRKAK